MLKLLLQDKKLIILLSIAILIRLFAFNASWVENYYSNGIYPVISRFFRLLFGWLPFSIGDVLYFVAGFVLLVNAWKFLRSLRVARSKKQKLFFFVRKAVLLGLWVYIIFSLSWGLNYFRLGIAHQLQLKVEKYSAQDLFQITVALQQRVNYYAEKVDSVQRLQLENNKILFEKGNAIFKKIETVYPFLKYSNPSIKPSFFSGVGHYFGFTGYFNPFTSEAQLNVNVPVFLRPAITAHEMAHQLGYAKENEASFVAYLAGAHTDNIDFQYSIYYELYRDASYECLKLGNKEILKAFQQNLHPRVRIDTQEWRNYLEKNKNFIEPFIAGIYDKYLKLNNQPKGRATYSEVIAWLIAYVKKFGIAAL